MIFFLDDHFKPSVINKVNELGRCFLINSNNGAE